MEPALRTFLDDLHEQDNLVRLESKAPAKAPAAPVRNDNSSGMLDLRSMAKQYQDMRGAGEMAKDDEHKATSAAIPAHVLTPRAATAAESSTTTRFLLTLSAGALVLVMVTAAVTAVITTKLVRSSMVAESDSQKAVPTLAQEVPSVVSDAPEMPAIAIAEVEDAPVEIEEPTPVVQEEQEEPAMNFDESEVAVISKPERRPERKPAAIVATPVVEAVAPTPAQPAAVVAAEPVAPAEEEVVAAVSSTEPAFTPESSEEPASASCDEVLCLIEGKGCCGKAANAKKPATAASAIDTSLPEGLTRSDIAAGIAPITGRLTSCGTRAGLLGAVTLKLKISADGKVLSTSANKGEGEFKSCITSILKKAKFAKTQRGTTLSYPIIVR